MQKPRIVLEGKLSSQYQHLCLSQKVGMRKSASLIVEKESERTQDQGAGLIRRGGEQESFGAEIAGIHAGAKGEERGETFQARYGAVLIAFCKSACHLIEGYFFKDTQHRRGPFTCACQRSVHTSLCNATYIVEQQVNRSH